MRGILSTEQRIEALKLRRSGKSYAEITQAIGVPKSTLAGWLKGVEFSEKVKQDQLVRVKLIWAKNIVTYNQRRSELYLKQREKEVSQHSEGVPKLTQRDLFFLGMGLYWGEGSKTEKWCVKLSNADPQLILAGMYFFSVCCGINRDKLRGSVHVHPNISADRARKYWSRVTGIRLKRIGVQTVQSRASRQLRPKNRLLFGTFHLIVYSAIEKRKIEGWLEGVKKQYHLPE